MFLYYWRKVKTLMGYDGIVSSDKSLLERRIEKLSDNYLSELDDNVSPQLDIEGYKALISLVYDTNYLHHADAFHGMSYSPSASSPPHIRSKIFARIKLL